MYQGTLITDVPCEIICVKLLDRRAEMWLRCTTLRDLLESMRTLASNGFIVLIGCLDGRVYKTLPARIWEFESSTRYDTSLEPDSWILVEPCSGNMVDAIRKLFGYSQAMKTRKNRRTIQIMLSRPTTIGYLFDNGIRLLQPHQAPPSYVVKKKSKLSSSS